MRQDDILLVRDTQFTITVGVSHVGHHVHLRRGGIAGRQTDGLQRDGHRNVVIALVRIGVVLHPAREGGISGLGTLERHAVKRRIDIGRIGEVALDARHFDGRHIDGGLVEGFPLFLDLTLVFVRPQGSDQNFDARLVAVVAAAIAVIDAQAGFEIAQQLVAGQALADAVRQRRGAAHAAADIDIEALRRQVQADIVQADGGAVCLGAGDGDLELARQEVEFRMVGRPLTDDLAPRTRIIMFVLGGAGELVGRGVAYAVARGLQAVHFDLCQMLQDLRHLGQLDPVELQVLARGEVAEITVIGAGDIGQLAHLGR